MPSGPVSPVDVRVLIKKPDLSSVLTYDAARFDQDFGGGFIKYEDTPSGCGAATLQLGLRSEDVFQRGYYTAMNVVQISTGDNVTTASFSSGATKVYVDSNAGFDTSKCPDQQMAYFWDGGTYTPEVPVTGIGSDGGGPYITIGTPAGGTIAAYSIGTTVGRRRYIGRIVRTNRPNQKQPLATITCTGFAGALDGFVGNFSLTAYDVGLAIYQAFLQFSSAGRMPYFVVSSGNFPTIGSLYTGNSTNTSLSRFVSNALTGVANGDVWSLRIGHDRTPRLVKLFTASSNTYTYAITLSDGVDAFEPQNIISDSEDASKLFNSVMVIGGTNTLTKQPYKAIVQDANSIALYTQIDATPVSNSQCLSDTACANYASSLLGQSSLATANNTFRTYTRNDNVSPVNQPYGMAQGDVVTGVTSVTLARFDATGSVKNFIPDSEFSLILGGKSIWTDHSSGLIITVLAGGPLGGPLGANSNALEYTGTGSASGFPNLFSPYIDVVPGQVWTISAYIDASHVTSGGPGFYVWNATQTAQYAQIIQTAGVAGRVSVTFTIPGGVTKIYIGPDNSNCVVTSGQKLIYAQPQLERGNVATGYVWNSASPNLYGLVQSAQTTLDTHGDRWQDVKFQAIQPDWSAAMAERSNALATALTANQAMNPSLDQFFVSANAWPPSFSSGSLIVTVPANPDSAGGFTAQFGTGAGNVKHIATSTFTLGANAIYWVWLNPNSTWTISTSSDGSVYPHTGSGLGSQTNNNVSGAILYGIFQTGPSGVIGATQKCAVGSIGMPMAWLINNVNYTPTFSSFSATQPVQDYITSSIAVSFHVTNQPTDGSFSKLHLWYRLSGQTTWALAWASPPLNSSGVQILANGPFDSTGVYSLIYPDASNGFTYEFGISLENSATQETVIVSIGTFTPAALKATGGLQTISSSALPPFNTNLVSDSNFQNSPFTNSTITGKASSSSYWIFNGIDGSSFYIGKGQASDGSNYWAFTSAASASSRYGYSLPIAVKTGQTYVVSLYADARNVTGSTLPGVGVYDFTSGTVGSSLTFATQTAGSFGRIQTSWTATAGVTQVVILPATFACTINSSTSGGAPGFLVLANPQFELSPTTPGYASPYKPTTGVLFDGTTDYNTAPGAIVRRIAPNSGLSLNDASTGGPGPITGNIPHPNNSLPVLRRILSSAALDVSANPGGGSTVGVAGLLPQANHDPTVILGAVTGTQKNLVPDSGIIFGSGGNGTSYWVTAVYWQVPIYLTIFFNVDGTGSNGFVFTSTGGTSGFVYAIAATMYLTAGTYTISGYINATYVTSGSPIWGVGNPGLSIGYGQATQTAGQSGRVQGTITIAASGTYVVYCDTSNCTVTIGHNLTFASPQLEAGSVMTAYQQTSNPDNAGTINHGAMSPATQAAIANSGNLIQTNLVGLQQDASGTLLLPATGGSSQVFGFTSGHAYGTSAGGDNNIVHVRVLIRALSTIPASTNPSYKIIIFNDHNDGAHLTYNCYTVEVGLDGSSAMSVYVYKWVNGSNSSGGGGVLTTVLGNHTNVTHISDMLLHTMDVVADNNSASPLISVYCDGNLVIQGNDNLGGSVFTQGFCGMLNTQSSSAFNLEFDIISATLPFYVHSSAVQSALNPSGHVIGIGGVLTAQNATLSSGSISGSVTSYTWTNFLGIDLTAYPSSYYFFVEAMIDAAPTSYQSTAQTQILPSASGGTITNPFYTSGCVFVPVGGTSAILPATLSFNALGGSVYQISAAVTSTGGTFSGSMIGKAIHIKATRRG